MEDINYDLMRLLCNKLKSVQRLERHYVVDAKDAGCHSVAALEKILADEKKHIEMIRDEIKMRCDNDLFN